MRVSAENLDRVLFAMYLAHDRNVTDELRDEIANNIEIIGEDEADVVAALVRLHDLIAAERKGRH